MPRASRSRPARAVAACLLVVGLAPAARADALKPPFDLARLPTTASKSALACDPPPASLRDVVFDGFYVEGTGASVVDRAAYAAYLAAQAPLKTFERGLVRMSDRYFTDGNPAAAACVLGWLDAWGTGGGYLGNVNRQGGFLRKWSLGTAVLAFLKIRGAPDLDTSRAARVLSWFRRWAEIVRDDYSTRLARSSRHNNHLYWAAWSVGLAGVALNDRSHVEWMVQVYQQAMRQIQPDGTLPLELARGSKALHYHLFSLQALVFVAELAARNGYDLYAEADGALARLIDRTLAGLDDPAFFAAKTGRAQSWVGVLNGSKLTWMEPYYTRFRDSRLAPWLVRMRPLGNARTGGNATRLYGTAKLN